MDKVNDLQIYGKEYHCWRRGIYLGIATWTDDENVGDEFLRATINSEGEIVYQVFRPDNWYFI